MLRLLQDNNKKNNKSPQAFGITMVGIGQQATLLSPNS